MSKTIIHVDMNAYFATCAQIIYPQYKGKPLAVGGQGSRSIISTASYEARKYGVHSAMPTYQAKRLCPNLIIVSPDFKVYERFTNQFVDIIRKYATKVEIASIDECYADISDNLKQTTLKPLQYIKNIQDEIYHQTGLSCSIGVAPNKFLAKMGSDYKKPMGLTVIRKKDVPAILWPIPIGDMYGCGKKTSKLLQEEYGINTIGDLANNTNPVVVNKLGKLYEVLHSWANGEGSDNVSEEIDDPKSIGNSQTFLFDTDDYDEITALFKELSASVSKRAERENKVGLTIQIVIRYYNFETVNRSVTLTKPTNKQLTIFYEAMKLFDRNYRDEPIRLLGVTLQNLSDEGSLVEQLSLFDDFTTKSKTEVIVDLLNEEYEKPTFKKLSDIKGKE